MKNSITILGLFISIALKAQIVFQGNPQPVDVLNSPNGQNYLIMDPITGTMAYTEENGGSGDEHIIQELFYDSSKVYVFKDWLGTPGMVSPLGFMNGNLLYNQVIFNKGMYYGLVMSLSGQTGERKPIIIPFFKNKSPIQSGCISPDGRYMILSLESNNSYGVEDLYVSTRNSDGSWSSLNNLGATLNTPFQEITPFLAADNKTLFFATNGRGGAGSFDLFYAVRQDDSWRNWSKPVNLGTQINTQGSETSFTFIDGSEWAYFISSQDSDGYGDILRIKMAEEIDKDTTKTEERLVVYEEKRKETVMLNVVDAKTNQSIAAVLLSSKDTLKHSSGVFTIDSLDGSEVEIKSEGYLPKVILLDNQLKVGQNFVALSSIAKGETIQLDHVLFHRGTADLVHGSERELNLVVEVMKDNPDIKILLKGHTDNTGDPVRNVQLSEERVKTVKEYILSQGINPYRVRGTGYGGNQPIASNETEETRKLNRRVEFEVVED